jgi:hypothetical protein
MKCLVGSVALAVLAACGGGGDDLNDRFDLADPKMRVVNVDPLIAAPISLFDGTSPIPGGANVARNVGTAYFTIENDSRQYIVRDTATTAEIDRETLDPDRGSKYTVLKFGVTPADVVIVRDPYDKGASTDGRVRVVNAAINTPDGIDVYLIGRTADVQTATPLFTDVDQREVDPPTNFNSTTVSPGEYKLVFAVTGTSPKVTPFSTNVTIPTNGDWLITIVSDVAGSLQSVKAVIVRDGEAPTTLVP